MIYDIMSTIKKTVSAALAVSLMIGIACMPANAQLRGFGNKLKNNAEKVVKDKGKKNEDKKDKGQDAASSASTTNAGDYDYNKKYTPSAEAVAADPLANSTEVKSGYTKSVGDIHAFYENVPDKYVISYLKPYYTEQNKIWYDLSPEAHNRLMYLYMRMFDELLSASMDRPLVINSYAEIAPGVQIPLDESFKNAWTLQYLADPTSASAFKDYLYAYAYKAYSNYPWLTWQQPAGTVLPDNFAKIGYARDDKAKELATTVLPYSTLQAIADSYIADVEGTSKPFAKYFYWIMADKVLNDFMPAHKDHKATDAYRAKVAQFESKYGNGNATLGNLLIASKKPAVAEPKGVAVSADIKAMGDKAGKEIAYGEYEKLIYHDSKWTVLKEDVWPYKIKGYSIPVSIVFKMDGKRWVISGALVKAPEGNNCFVQNGDTSTASPLK